MLNGQHQRVDIPAPARTAHKGLLQKRLEEDLCWIIPHVPPVIQSVRRPQWIEWYYFIAPVVRVCAMPCSCGSCLCHTFLKDQLQPNRSDFDNFISLVFLKLPQLGTASLKSQRDSPFIAVWQHSRPNALAFKIFLFWCRNDWSINIHWTNKCKCKHTSNVVLYSIHIKVVPLNGETPQNNNNNKQTEF